MTNQPNQTEPTVRGNPNDPLGEMESHPSYGCVQISRRTSTAGVPLFMSDLQHNHIVNITINTAEKNRAFHSNCHFQKDQIISIMMSEAQFARLVSSPNQGSGVPCTLERVNGELVPQPPVNDATKTYAAEIKRDLGVLTEVLENLKTAVCKIVEKPRLDKEDKKFLQNSVDRALQQVKYNLPFAQTCMEENLEKAVEDARIEIESHIANIASATGLAALQSGESPILGIAKTEEEVSGGE